MGSVVGDDGRRREPAPVDRGNEEEKILDSALSAFEVRSDLEVAGHGKKDRRVAADARALDPACDRLLSQVPLHEGRRQSVFCSGAPGGSFAAECDGVRSLLRREGEGPGDPALTVEDQEEQTTIQFAENRFDCG